jgi:hypothetical protein|tara:strand:- start:1185 stop:1832 length:648 start_codon:yes stop_codon:yes gene_type:complete
MSNRPKKQDYKPSEDEKISASVALAEKNYFDENYGPLLRRLRDITDTQDFSNISTGRAGADVMQGLTGRTSLQRAISVDAAADLASAAGSQQLEAERTALAAKREGQIGVLGTARGQQADAVSGLSRAANIQSTSDLSRARDKQMIADARLAAGLNVGGTLFGQGIQNRRSMNAQGQYGTFFSPAGLGTQTADGPLGRLDVGRFGRYTLGGETYG